MSEPFDNLLNAEVILDTATPIVYIGKLIAVTDHTFVLAEADMHDCRDGHAKKELYLRETREHGTTVNRRRIVVLRSAVISVSRLVDVVAD